jgi:ribosomal protein S18 acetylase RimI-like enzyme
VVTDTGDVAAYSLFWMDPVTRVGLVEPMRTEDEFQRRGLGSALLSEGICRLREEGAESIKVSYRETNEPARGLYHGRGFRDLFRKLEYRRETPDLGSSTGPDAR